MLILLALVSALISLTGSTLPPIWDCNNLCPFAYSGECQDCGPGSVSCLCMYGFDCADCGVRPPYTSRPSNPTTPMPTLFNPFNHNPSNSPIITNSPTIYQTVLCSQYNSTTCSSQSSCRWSIKKLKCKGRKHNKK